MKRILSVIIALAMTIGIAPLAVFAGGGNDFPPEACLNADPMRPEGSYSDYARANSTVYINFYSGAEDVYAFEVTGGGNLTWAIYDSEGNQLSYYDNYRCEPNFTIYARIPQRVDVYIAVTNDSNYASFFTVTNAYSEVTDVEVVSWPTVRDYLRHYSYVRTEGLMLKLTYRDGMTAMWCPSVEWRSPDGVELEQHIDFPDNGIGEGTAHFSCYGFNFEFPITFVDYNYDGARILRMPDKTEYIPGVDYEFDLTGLQVQLTKGETPVETLTFAGPYEGYPEPVYTVSFPEDIQVGENYIMIVFYNVVQIDFALTGIESPVSSIELLKDPDKTEYAIYGGGFPYPELTGAKLRIHYKNGGSKDVDITDPYYTDVDGHNINAFFAAYPTIGKNVVNVSYCGVTCSYVVDGVAPNIDNIEFNVLPEKLEYYLGEDQIDLAGASLYINYTAGTYDEVFFDGPGAYFDGYDIWGYLDSEPQLGQNPVRVSYKGASTTFYVTYKECDVKRVSVVQEPDKTHYPVTGYVQREDLAGLKLDILHADGTKETWDYSENNGFYAGERVFIGSYVRYEGPNSLHLYVAGFDTVVYVIGDPFSVTDVSVVAPPNDQGNFATIHCVTGDGGEFEITFVGVFEDDVADGIATVPGYGSFGYSLWRKAEQDGESGVMIYCFDREIFVPYGSETAKGDMDGDGEITVADALKALRIAAKLVAPTEQDIALGDVDNDGEITVADALKILRVAAKLADPSSL